MAITCRSVHIEIPIVQINTTSLDLKLAKKKKKKPCKIDYTVANTRSIVQFVTRAISRAHKFGRQRPEPTNQNPREALLQCRHCSPQFSSAVFYPWHPNSEPAEV